MLADGSLVAEKLQTVRYSRREDTGSVGSTNETRTETEKDRGRIGYSPFLRRLAGVTQVVSPDLASSQLHTRGSHTYKVAMIARELAESIARKAVTHPPTADVILRHGGLDIAACEAAGLAHDLGHPPFGHAGEQELNRLLRANGVEDGFEGNAQSFRIVTTLERHRVSVRGLNLTNVTLGAILKYPWLRDMKSVQDLPKFGAYRSEEGELRRARLALFPENKEHRYPLRSKTRPRQSLEASVMDLADDIAYSIHDLEDFVSAGAIDLRSAAAHIHRALLHFEGPEKSASNPFVAATTRLKEFEGGSYSEDRYVEALQSVEGFFSRLGLDATMSQSEISVQTLRAQLSRRISDFFASVDVDDTDSSRPAIRLNVDKWHEMQVLKLITKQYLISTARMGLIQRAQTQVIRNLFNEMTGWLDEAPALKSLPVPLRESLANLDLSIPSRHVGLHANHFRAISDYICGMSDSEALLRSQWSSGTEVPGMTNLGVTY